MIHAQRYYLIENTGLMPTHRAVGYGDDLMWLCSCRSAVTMDLGLKWYLMGRLRKRT
jgi:hypothetical protein